VGGVGGSRPQPRALGARAEEKEKKIGAI